MSTVIRGPGARCAAAACAVLVSTTIGFSAAPRAASANVPRGGGLLWMVDTVNNRVDLLDAKTHGVVSRLPANYTPSLFYTSRKVPNKAFLLSVYDTKVAVYDTRENRLTNMIKIPAYTELAAFNPDASRLYVAYFTQTGQGGINGFGVEKPLVNGVAVIDTKTEKMVDDIRFRRALPGTQIAVVTVSPDGRHVYTADYAGNVYDYSLKAKKVVRHTNLGITAPVPGNLYMSPTGDRLYSVNIEPTNPTGGSVTTIDTRTFKVTNNVKVGANPFVNEVRPGTPDLWLTSSSGNEIYVFDLATGRIKQKIKTDRPTLGVGFDRSGKHAYVAFNDAIAATFWQVYLGGTALAFASERASIEVKGAAPGEIVEYNAANGSPTGQRFKTEVPSPSLLLVEPPPPATPPT